MMSTAVVLYIFVNLLTSVLGQIGLDGFENQPCLRITDFEIDGDWYAKSEGAVDWSSVLEGTRDTATNLEWLSTQNQCTINPAIRWGYLYKAGIFCDTFDLDENSQLQSGTKHNMDCCPNLWIPLRTTSMQDKGDLTNVYYVGSDLDLIICAAFERIDVHGASYMDLEFNQIITDNIAGYPSECNSTRGLEWKCLYPSRINSDIQIAFKIANDITNNIITISQWDTSSTSYKAIRVEDMATAPDSYYYKSADGAFEAAVNNGTIKASSFGRICDDKNYNPDTNPTDCPNIGVQGAFFEACIDFKKLGFTSLDFSDVIVKARASSNGAYKDTSGVLYHTIQGPKTYPTVVSAECNLIPPTPFPSRAPSESTPNPTTAMPTDSTSAPTLYPTQPTTDIPTAMPTDTTSSPTDSTDGPTSSPIITTAQPTAIPTDSTDAPTQITISPTTDSMAPTMSPVSCDDDDDYLRFDCPDSDGTGCSLKAQIQINVCILNRKFGRNGIYGLVKESFIKIIDDFGGDFNGFCILDELHIEVYRIVFDNDAAKTAGSKEMKSYTECEDMESVCGPNKDNLERSVIVSVGLFCGDCTKSEELKSSLLEMIESGSFQTKYGNDFRFKSIQTDDLCSDGVGAAEISNICIDYRDNNGDIVGDECDLNLFVTTSAGDGGNGGNTDNATQINSNYYIVALSLTVFILSSYNLLN